MNDELQQLREALSDYAQCLGIVGAEQEARHKLESLRSAKTSWVGKAENDLRFAIDKALR